MDPALATSFAWNHGTPYFRRSDEHEGQVLLAVGICLIE
jgi:hypothetical protein